MLRHNAETIEDGTREHPHWTLAIGTQTECMHCGQERVSEFCGSCGQRHIHQRLQFGEWVKQTLSRITQVDRGVLFTFWHLLIRPGHVARAYVEGRRKPYLNPLTCFFLGAALQLLAFWILEGQIRQMISQPIQQVVNQDAARAADAEKIEEKTGKPISELAVESYLDSIRGGYTYLALLTMAVPLAFFTRFAHSLRGEEFLLAETMVWALYVVSVMLSLTAITNVLIMPFFGQAAGLVGISAYFVLVWHGHRGFFQPGFGSRLVTLFSMCVSAMLFFGSILTTFLLTLGLRLASS
ncbi:MAG: DUF3667 domain-containing protein [Planctomycetota bacterium]